jgi:hypothetical protein
MEWTLIDRRELRYWHEGMDEQDRLHHDACMSLHYPRSCADFEDDAMLRQCLIRWTEANKMHFQWLLSDDDFRLYWNKGPRK